MLQNPNEAEATKRISIHATPVILYESFNSTISQKNKHFWYFWLADKHHLPLGFLLRLYSLQS